VGKGEQDTVIVTQVNQTQSKANEPAEEYSNLGAGCYVKIVDGDCSYWTEILKVEGASITAVVHPELDENPSCNNCKSSVSAVSFTKEHIVDLGCDNYCWC